MPQIIPTDANVPPPMSLGKALKSIFTRDALRLPPHKWRALRKRIGVLPESDELKIQTLRKKNMSCVYAERSRERRAIRLQAALAQAAALQTQLKKLEEENKMLRNCIQDLQKTPRIYA